MRRSSGSTITGTSRTTGWCGRRRSFGTGGPIVLATPVSGDRPTAVRGGDLRWEDDRIVGFDRSQQVVVLATWQPAADGVRPPLVADPTALQRAVVDGHRFVPDPGLGWVERVGWTSAPSIGSAERNTLERVLRTADLRPVRFGAAIFRVNHPSPDGLPGALVGRGGVTRGAIGVAGIAAVVGSGSWWPAIAGSSGVRGPSGWRRTSRECPNCRRERDGRRVAL